MLLLEIKEEYLNETVINKSRFICCIKPCKTELDARNYIDSIRKEFSDATHVCTAYILGDNQEIQRSSDNGEPSGTAGIPMLESIKNNNITNICTCVVRYFGGIKLGAGGLIRAYSGSVNETIKKAKKIKYEDAYIYNVTYPYDLVGIVETYLRKNTNIIQTEYNEKVVSVFVALKTLNVIDELTSLTKAKVEITCIDETKIAIDYD